MWKLSNEDQGETQVDLKPLVVILTNVLIRESPYLSYPPPPSTKSEDKKHPSSWHHRFVAFSAGGTETFGLASDDTGAARRASCGDTPGVNSVG
jgi:hypothetical protein